MDAHAYRRHQHLSWSTSSRCASHRRAGRLRRASSNPAHDLRRWIHRCAPLCRRCTIGARDVSRRPWRGGPSTRSARPKTLRWCRPGGPAAQPGCKCSAGRSRRTWCLRLRSLAEGIDQRAVDDAATRMRGVEIPGMTTFRRREAAALGDDRGGVAACPTSSATGFPTKMIPHSGQLRICLRGPVTPAPWRGRGGPEILLGRPREDRGLAGEQALE